MKKTFIALLISALLLPAVSFAATFDQNLSYGSSGSAVTNLQNFLTTKGLYTGPITGSFFNLTKGAVIAFQKQNDIQPASGFVGPLTRAVLNRLILSAASSSATSSLVASQTHPTSSVQLLSSTTSISPLASTSGRNISTTPKIVTPPPNSTLCNGTYWNNCSAGEQFACLSTGGTCHAPDAGFCNNQYWGACPSGETWSCAVTGGVCSAPPQAITQPIVSPLPVVTVVPPAPSSTVPTSAQFCQQLHDQELASTTQEGEAMVQQATNNYDQVYAYEEAQLNSFAANGFGNSGVANLAQQDINKAQAEVASATAQYQGQLANIETVQTCLSALTPTN